MSAPPPTTPLITITIADRCVGYLIRRGKSGFEAFGPDDKSRGIFTSETEAVGAVMRSSGT